MVYKTLETLSINHMQLLKTSQELVVSIFLHSRQILCLQFESPWLPSLGYYSLVRQAPVITLLLVFISLKYNFCVNSWGCSINNNFTKKGQEAGSLSWLASRWKKYTLTLTFSNKLVGIQKNTCLYCQYINSIPSKEDLNGPQNS